jgi:hypothetical protein
MSADQIAELAPGVREALADSAYCATFEVSGLPDMWVQFHDGVLNAAYPYESNPTSLLAELGGSLEEWEAEQFVTVELGTDDVRTLAKWIDAYFVQVLHAEADYAVDVRIERM